MAIAALLVRFDGGAKRLVVVGHVAPPAPVAQPLSQPLPPPSPPAAVPRPAPAPKSAARERSSVALDDAAGGARFPADAIAAAPPRPVAG